jgi:hypothetical protein
MPAKRYSLSDLQKLEADQIKQRQEQLRNNSLPNTPDSARKKEDPNEPKM